ncbi:MAG: hypothetical protein CMM01_07575 [Rhodopirellula sp.]|nr:hypothetical protein [Rhodopirellula sp.]
MKRFCWLFVSWAAALPLVSGWLALVFLLFGCLVGVVELEVVPGGVTVEWESSRGVWKVTT